MLDSLVSLVTTYGEAVKTNPVLAMFGVYIAGVFTYIIRNVPTKMWNFTKNQCTTSLTIDNSGYDGNAIQFSHFINWYSKSPWFKHSRSTYLGAEQNIVRPNNGPIKVNGPGVGFHFFMYKGRFFWFDVSPLDSSGSEKLKKSISIFTFGRSHKPLIALTKEFVLENNLIPPSIYRWSAAHYNWQFVQQQIPRDLSTVVLHPEIKAALVKDIDWFVNNEEWFRSRPMAYKLSFLFHGPSGTGKTSLSRSIASTLSRHIYMMDLSVMNNESLRQAVTSLPKKSCLLIEDIEASTPAVGKRTDENMAPSGDLITNESGSDRLTLSGILNTLDGIIQLDDIIVLMTTNHINRLDSALIRKSRVDRTFLIDNMSYMEVQEYFNLMYPEYKGLSSHITKDNCPPKPGCDVFAIFKDNPFNPQGFIDEVTVVKHDVKELEHATAA